MEWYLCFRNEGFFGINILRGIGTLPQYHLYWHNDKFVGNAGAKDTMTLKRYEKLMQYLHVSDWATEPQARIVTSCTRYNQSSKWYKRASKYITILARTKQLMKQWLASRGSSPMSGTCQQNQSSMISKCGWDRTWNQHICMSLTCTLVVDRIPYMAWHMMLSWSSVNILQVKTITCTVTTTWHPFCCLQIYSTWKSMQVELSGKTNGVFLVR